MKHIVSVLFGLSLLLSLVLGQNESIKSGDWTDPSVWSSNLVPADSIDVTINSGDTILMPTVGQNQNCQNLTIKPGGVLLLRSKNFTVSGETRISGLLADTVNAGNNLFLGEVIIEEGGQWNTIAVTSPLRVVFEGGLTFHGDSLNIFKCKFEGNDQAIKGSKPIYFTQSISIGPDIRLENQSEAGLFLVNGSIQCDSTATFANHAHLEVLHNLNFITGGTVDFTVPGNTVYLSRNGVQNIPVLSYYNLVLIADTSVANARRNVNESFSVLNDLWVAPNAQLFMSVHNIDVGGTTYVYGAIRDDNMPGSFVTRRMEMIDGAQLDGNPNEWGQMQILEELRIKGLDNRINEVELYVDSLLYIEGEAQFKLNSPLGTKHFNELHMEDKGVFLDNTTGGLYTFSGPAYIDGIFPGNKSSYIFEGLITLADSGIFAPQQNIGHYEFLGGFINHGLADFGLGSYRIAGEFGGSRTIIFPNEVHIAAGQTLLNTDTAGLVFQNIIDGEDADCLLENAAVLFLAPTQVDFTPMDTGKVDFCSHLGNTVKYAAEINKQRLISTCYQNVDFLLNTKLMRDGDINIHGDVYCEVSLQENANLFTAGLVRMVGAGDQYLSGDGVFREIEIAKPSGNVIALDTVFVNKSLIMTQGILIADPGSIGMLGSSTIAETDSSYVLGTVGAERNVGAGAGNAFGGLGLKITADKNVPLGSTIVIRVTGRSYEPGLIDRYYQVIPANNTDLDAQIEFGYHEREINGANEADLDVVHMVDGGEFEVLGGKKLTVSNLVRKSAINSFGIISLKPSSLAVNAFPNPFEDELTVSFVLSQAGPAHVSIFDRSSRLVLHKEFDGQEGLNQFIFDRETMRPGMYFVRVVAENEEKAGFQKVIKSRP